MNILRKNFKTKNLRKANNQLEKSICQHSDKIYTNMILYLRGSKLTNSQVEQVRNDLICMILDSQARGDDIDKLFAGKEREICQDIIDSMPTPSLSDKLKEFAIMLIGTYSFLSLIKIIFDGTAKKVSYIIHIWGFFIIRRNYNRKLDICNCYCNNGICHIQTINKNCF